MKRSLYSKFLKGSLLAVPAAAMMLGASHGATLGIHWQVDWSKYNPQYSYSTSGWIVTGNAFGVEPANWFNAPQVPFATSATDSGVPSNLGNALISWSFDWIYSTGIGNLNPDATTPAVLTPGNDQVTWTVIEGNGNNTNASPWTVEVSGLANYFPSGFMVQTVSARGGGTGKPASMSIGDVSVAWNSGASSNILSYTTWRAIGGYYDSTALSTVGLSSSSTVITNDAVKLTTAVPWTVDSPLAAAIITDQPVITRDPIGSTVGSAASFSLTATVIGIPTLRYQWRTNGIPIPGATAATYSVASASPGDSGTYDLVVTNTMGGATSAVALVTVIGTPAITAGIQSDTNYYNLDQFFFITTAGAQPMSYQWLRNGTAIPGATSASLAITNLQASDSGSTFKVIVTNSLGAATSSVATLTVTSPPYDGFNYPDGSLTGRGAGSSWGGPWVNSGPPNYNGDNSVAQPSLAYMDASYELATVGGAVQVAASGSQDFDDIRALTGKIGGSGTVYVSFLGQMNYDAAGIELVEDAGTNSYSRLFLGVPLYATTWGFGWYPTATLSSTPRADLSFLVYRLDFTPTDTQVRLYINPTLSSEPLSATLAGSAGWFQFNKVRIVARQHANLNVGQIDELRIGGTWAAIAPAVPRTDPPSITKDLAGISSSVYVGGVVTMSIAAAGGPPLHYQWKLNGTTPIGTDSPTLSRSGVLLSESGDYSCVVTNTHGSASSASNHITVVTPPDSYTMQVALDGPSAYWPLNEAAAPTAYDYSSHGNDGMQNGGLTPGGVGPRPPAFAGFSAGNAAYQFDGASSSVDCGTGPALSGTTDFTLEAWINTAGPVYGYTNCFILQQRGSGIAGEYMFYVNENGTLQFAVYNGGYQFNFGSPSAGKLVNDGHWHHVVAVRAGTSGVIYIDGSAAAGASGPAAILNPAYPVAIGYDVRDNSSYFNGWMCGVAIYNAALSAATIQTHYAVGKTGSAPANFNAPTLNNGQLTISWTGTATLLQSTNAALPMSQWTPTPNNPTSPYNVTPAAGGPRSFYRLKQ